MNPQHNTREFAKQRLQEVVTQGTAKAGPVIQRILSSQPEDTLVAAKALHFDVGTDVVIRAGESEWSLHEHAANQLYERLGGIKFKGFANEQRAAGADWRNAMLQRDLAEFASHTKGQYLVRAVRQGEGLQARAVLSDKFRRLDTRPMLDAFIGAATAIKAVPYEGVASDLRASVRAVIPTIYEPVPGEAIVFGLSWTNSDYGAGGYSISMFLLRLVCLNGMVGANQLKQVHLGGRLSEDLKLSQKTYELDTKTMVSATSDIVRAALNPRAIETQLETIRRAAEPTHKLNTQWAAIGKALTKTETGKVREAFDGPDTINLPPGNTAWRLSNALSWVANAEKVPAERKLELQELAGKIVS
jgi:hypothetical protein